MAVTGLWETMAYVTTNGNTSRGCWRIERASAASQQPNTRGSRGTRRGWFLASELREAYLAAPAPPPASAASSSGAAEFVLLRPCPPCRRERSDSRLGCVHVHVHVHVRTNPTSDVFNANAKTSSIKLCQKRNNRHAKPGPRARPVRLFRSLQVLPTRREAAATVGASSEAGASKKVPPFTP